MGVASFEALWGLVTGLFDTLSDGIGVLVTYWFCFIPIVLLVGKRIISVGKSLLFYKTGGRRRG